MTTFSKCAMLCIAGAIQCLCHAGQAREPRAQAGQPKAIRTGQEALDLNLARLSFETLAEGGVMGKISDERVRLSQFRGKKPVFLVFSSYT